jgi:hypothetical protein
LEKIHLTDNRKPQAAKISRHDRLLPLDEPLKTGIF